jgi:hypothetical protein
MQDSSASRFYLKVTVSHSHCQPPEIAEEKMNMRTTASKIAPCGCRHLIRRRFASTVSTGLLKELESRGFVAATTRSAKHRQLDDDIPLT